MHRDRIWGMVGLAAALMTGPARAQDAADGQAEMGRLVLAVSEAGGQPMPARVHLRDKAGRPVQPPDLPFWNDHFVIGGRTTLELPIGQYQYTIERGPEYLSTTGTVDVAAGAEQTVAVSLTQIVDMAEQGWYSGDLHIHRPVDDIPRLLDAEALNFGGVVTWWNQQNVWAERPLPENPRRLTDSGRAYDLMVGEDEREGGALLYYGLNRPLDIARATSREVPSPLVFASEALRLNRDLHLDAEKPFWWDFPTWAAFGLLDTVGLSHNHMHRSGILDNEAWGFPRDRTAYPGSSGNGRWTLDIYTRLLETGMRIPPSAGSASGVLPNPVGYNRVYVQIPNQDHFDPTLWWEGLREGRSFVTNGPLLVCRADGEPPGRVFRAKDGTRVPLQLVITVSSRDPIDTIEVVRNGRVVSRFGAGPTRGVPGPIERTTTLTFDQAGWFLVRAIADVPGTFRFAQTAPYYVEIGEIPRVSRSACDFFIKWTYDRMDRIEQTVKDPAERDALIGFHEQALDAWNARRGLATID